MPDKMALLPHQIEHIRRLKESSILLVRKAPQGIFRTHGRLGIFPASFNPPTKAHVALIRRASRVGHLDEMLVVLDAQAMDKELFGARLEDRVAMLKRLFQRDPKISIGISNRGLFVEKLAPLRGFYPAPIAFTFILGFDTILRVMDKKYYKNLKDSLDKLFKESRFIVANRGEQDREAFDNLLEHPGNKRFKNKVSFLLLPKGTSYISSSLVRNRIRDGKSVDELVPSPVLRFIEETGLYANSKQQGKR